MKLYVKDVVREPNDTLYTFLYKVLHFDGNGFGKAIVNSTYFDPEFKELQCTTGKFRSFDDLVLISKTYFRVSDKAIAKVLIKFINQYDNLGFVLCDSAKKWVFYYGISTDYLMYCANYKESYNKTDQKGIGVYSFNDIITLMGLTIEDLEV